MPQNRAKRSLTKQDCQYRGLEQQQKAGAGAGVRVQSSTRIIRLPLRCQVFESVGKPGADVRAGD